MKVNFQLTQTINDKIKKQSITKINSLINLKSILSIIPFIFFKKKKTTLSI
jgi:hypothetical protein